MIAAQMITQLCAGLPASIKVVGRAEGFSITAGGGHWILCATVHDVWSAIYAVAPSACLILNDVPRSLVARYADETVRRLFEVVIEEGRRKSVCGRSSRAG